MNEYENNRMNFYTCDTLTIKKPDPKLIITDSSPEILIPDSYVVSLNKSNCNLVYYNFLLQDTQIDDQSFMETPATLQEFYKLIKNIQIEESEQELSEDSIKNINSTFDNLLNDISSLNNGYQVGISEWNVGKEFIFSSDFNACHAVVARLKNGNYAIYHALHHTITLPLQKLLETIHDEVTDLYIVKKKKYIKHQENGAFLALKISLELPHVNVKTIVVDDYSCIAVYQDKIVLGKELIVDETDNDTLCRHTELTAHPLSDAQPIEENILIVLKLNEFKFHLNKNKDFVLDSFKIVLPKEMMKSAKQFVSNKIREESKNNVSQNIYSLYNQSQSSKQNLKIINKYVSNNQCVIL